MALSGTHISKVPGHYHCKMMLPFTICHWVMLIFPHSYSQNSFSSFPFPIPRQRLLLSLPMMTLQQFSLLPTLVKGGFRQRQDKLSLWDQGTNPREGRAQGTGTEHCMAFRELLPEPTKAWKEELIHTGQRKTTPDTLNTLTSLSLWYQHPIITVGHSDTGKLHRIPQYWERCSCLETGVAILAP